MAGDRIALAFLLATGAAGAVSVGACAQGLGAAEKGKAVADTGNPIARLDSAQVESVSLQRFRVAGQSVEEARDDGTVVIRTGGPAGDIRSTNCALAAVDAAAVVAILASAVPDSSPRETMPLGIQAHIRSAGGAEIVATLPPRAAPESDGSFVVAIAAGADARFYRIDDRDLARIVRIAETAGCADH